MGDCGGNVVGLVECGASYLTIHNAIVLERQRRDL